MERISRKITSRIMSAIDRGKSILLLGPRQTGKTTLLTELPVEQTISLARPALRQQYEKDIESFSQEIEALAELKETIPLIAIDEVQKIPELMDAVQDLIDRKVAQFILTGSSARKLRTQHELNWLPGRVVHFHLDPLSISELPKMKQKLEDLLLYGSLPGIVCDTSNDEREEDLNSYIVTYLEEEVRQEALVRKLGDFAKFLQLAAAESGYIINSNRISQDIGVAQTTISAYYQILEDCLIAERIEPYLKNNKIRRRLSKSPKYLLFDLGVRRIAAHEGLKLPEKILGHLFEQFIGLELLRHIRQSLNQAELYFWRDLEGREVDWVISYHDKLIPIEVKWTTNPSIQDARHLKTFLADYNQKVGYIVCRCDKPRKLDNQITAIPWYEIVNIVSK